MLLCTRCRDIGTCSVRLYPVPGINLALQLQIYRLQPCEGCAGAGAECSNAGQLVYLDERSSGLSRAGGITRQNGMIGVGGVGGVKEEDGGSGGGDDGRVRGTERSPAPRRPLRYLLNPGLGAGAQDVDWEFLPVYVTLTAAP